MDSPDFIHPQYCQEINLSLKNSNSEDSGYVTVATPNSTERTGFSSGISSISYSQPFNERILEKSHPESSQLCSTPCLECESMSFSKTPHNLLSSTRIFSTSINTEFNDPNILQRSNAIEMDWSPSVDPVHIDNNLNVQLSMETESSHSIDGKFSDSINEPMCSLETPKKKKISNLVSYRPTKKICNSKKSSSYQKNLLLYENIISSNNFYSSNKKPIKKDYAGLDKIDFLKLLDDYDCADIVLSHLSNEDLFNVSQVSEKWKSICCDYQKPKKRLEMYKDSYSINKENITAKDSSRNVKPRKILHRQKTCIGELSDKQNVQNIMQESQTPQKSPPVSPGKRKFNSYTKVASEEGVKELRSCPKCSRPAKLNGEWAECTGLDCKFVYCFRCHNQKKLCRSPCPNTIKASSPNKESPEKINPTIKKSRKNLKRLLF